MQKIIILFFKSLRLLKGKFLQPVDWLMGCFIFYTNGVHFSRFNNSGWPRVSVGRGGKCIIGYGFRSNNREMSNPIGRFNRCSLIVGNKGTLIIGDNVGMSSTAIVCHNRIEIGNNVNLGGNVVIYDTDFHSLIPKYRLNPSMDILNTNTKPIIIGNNVFIGAHTTILKGVTIGDNAIVGACSVVTADIPANEIWAGNPTKKIRNLNPTSIEFQV
jgi:acetyltransferase-like isoleucine patch superfamily enzyme